MSLNLLPWRQRLQSKNKRFIYMIALLACLLVIPIEYCIVGVFHNRLTTVEVEHIAQESRRFIIEKKIGNDSICLHADLVKSSLEKMQRNHMLHVNYMQLLKEISQSMPSSCELTQLDVNNKEIILTGLSSDNKNLNELVRHLDKVSLIAKAKLAELKNLKTSPHIYFIIKAELLGRAA